MYFEWASETPLKEERAIVCDKEINLVEVSKMRAFTLTGLCRFLGVSHNVLDTYAEKEEFSHVVQAIRDVIYTQKFEGAAANLLNATIISRDLGLREQTSSELMGKDGEALGPNVIIIQAANVPNDSVEEPA